MNKQLKPHFYIIIFCIITSLVLAGCEGDDTPDFDRTAMLENMADNLIIPAYDDLASALDSLQKSVTAFTQDPSTTSLAPAQQDWENAYLAWQYANAYNFGPAGAEGLRKALTDEVSVFPVSETKLENAASSGTYNLTDANRDARGFLAIEYLLFDLQNNHSAIVDKFVSANRKKLLNDLVANVRSRIETVRTSWLTSYRNEFVSANGTDVGSGTSQLYNEFLRSYEIIKNFKVALPLGKQPEQNQTEPEKVEAYYSGTSVKMFKANITAIENIWYGKKKDGTDGIGFEEYLQKVSDGPALVTSTKAQLELVKSAMNAIPDTPRFSTQLDSAPQPIDNFNTELQKLTHYFKGEMSSLLGLAITFSSGDGD